MLTGARSGGAGTDLAVPLVRDALDSDILAPDCGGDGSIGGGIARQRREDEGARPRGWERPSIERPSRRPAGCDVMRARRARASTARRGRGRTRCVLHRRRRGHIGVFRGFALRRTHLGKVVSRATGARCDRGMPRLLFFVCQRVGTCCVENIRGWVGCVARSRSNRDFRNQKMFFMV